MVESMLSAKFRDAAGNPARMRHERRMGGAGQLDEPPRRQRTREPGSCSGRRHRIARAMQYQRRLGYAPDLGA